MEYIMNNAKYAERTLTDDEIEHKTDYTDIYKHSMSEMMRNKEMGKGDRKAIEEHFEKRIW